MFKDKVNFKLINFCILALTIFIMYKTSGLWITIVKYLGKILLPFLLAFILAYALNPIVRYLKKKKVPKFISITLIIIIILSLIVLIITIFLPLLFNESVKLFGEIIVFLKQISDKYNIDVNSLEQTLMTSFNSILSSMGKYISDGLINFIRVILNYSTLFLIFISSSIYFLIDMDNIRDRIGKLIKKFTPKASLLIETIDIEMKKYFVSFFKIMFITLFEYGIGFLIIGHPNYLLLGILASLASLIPCFGGMAINCVAAITAFVINFKLFIRTIILFFILSLLDSYVINPLVYGKSNKVPSIITIFSVFAGGIIFGMLGIIISLPLAIILLTIYRFYKKTLNKD